jgi:DNA-binding NarL/FixJ family response regulator
MRAGLRMLLESQPGFAVVGEASTCADALALATGTQPDVIVLDLDLGGENAIESIPMDLPLHFGQATPYNPLVSLI